MEDGGVRREEKDGGWRSQERGGGRREDGGERRGRSWMKEFEEKRHRTYPVRGRPFQPLH